MDHVCHFLLTRTKATGFEFRVCHTCGATPPQTIILSSKEMAERLRPATVCAEKTESSVAQHTEGCYFSEMGEADRKAQR